MSSMNSNVALGGTIAIVLLMMLAAIPFVDAASDDVQHGDLVFNPENPVEYPDCYWDNEYNYLLLSKGFEAASITITDISGDVEVYVFGSIHIGSLTFLYKEDSKAYIYGVGSAVDVVCDGKIITKPEYGYENKYCNLDIRNVNLVVNDGYIHAQGAMNIYECPSVNVTGAEGSDEYLIQSSDNFEAYNIDIHLDGTNMGIKNFMKAENYGISLVNKPEESGLKYDGTDTWSPGVKTICGDTANTMTEISYQMPVTLISDLMDASGDGWRWDNEHRIFYISKDIRCLEMLMTMKEDPVTVYLLGDVTIDSHVMIHARGDVIITGDEGKKLTVGNIIFDSFGTLTVKGISVESDVVNFIYTMNGNVKIQDCPSVSLNTSKDRNGIICTKNGSVEISNTNLSILIRSPNVPTAGEEAVLISSGKGITMDCEPTGEGLIFDNGKWVSGVTKAISGSGPNISLIVAGHDPGPEPKPSHNLNVPLMVMLAIVSLIALYLMCTCVVSRSKH